MKYGPNGLEIKEQKKKKSNKYCNDKFYINDNKNNKKKPGEIEYWIQHPPPYKSDDNIYYI